MYMHIYICKSCVYPSALTPYLPMQTYEICKQIK